MRSATPHSFPVSPSLQMAFPAATPKPSPRDIPELSQGHLSWALPGSRVGDMVKGEVRPLAPWRMLETLSSLEDVGFLTALPSEG